MQEDQVDAFETGQGQLEEDKTHLHFKDSLILESTPDELWDTISDPETLASCVPGADEIERVSERKYTGKISRGVSHLSLTLTGEVELVELNEPSWIVAEGSVYDSKTHSEFDILAAMEVTAVDDETVQLSYSVDLPFTGGVSQLSTEIIRALIGSDIDAYFENVRSIVED